MPFDRTLYHPKWELISRMIRFGRAGNCCEWCGARNLQPHPVTGSKVILTVAHLYRDPSQNRFAFLKALCQWCHLNYDRPKHIANRRYGREHDGPNQFRLDFAPEFYTPRSRCT